MHRLFVLAAAALALALGVLGLAVAQDATPETNVLGTPCPSPAAGTPALGTPATGDELGVEATPGAEGTPAVEVGCPVPGAVGEDEDGPEGIAGDVGTPAA